MSLLAKAKQQEGALYVEAAIIMPVLLLVTFASLFFFLVAARHFTLQMLANEIAKDVSLSLQPIPTEDRATACIPKCMQEKGSTLRNDGYQNTKNLTYYASTQFSSGSGCWNVCARGKYLLATPGTNAPYQLSVTVTAHPTMQYYDETLPSNSSVASAGDFFEVSLAYPLRAVWGGGIAFFGLIPETSSIYGNAVGVIDKRENP